MNKSVEAVADVGIKKGRTAGVAFRQPDQSPTHLLVIDPHHLEADAMSIVARILEIERSRGCGAYLFVNDAMHAFVITEEKPLAAQWAKARFRELVGYYRTVRPADRRIPTLAPTATGLLEDLVDHLADLLRVPAPELKEADGPRIARPKLPAAPRKRSNDSLYERALQLLALKPRTAADLEAAIPGSSIGLRARLVELVDRGIVRRRNVAPSGPPIYEYRLVDAGDELA